MRKIPSLVLLALAALPAAAQTIDAETAGTETVDTVIGRHVAARGGDAWASIRTIRMTGNFTAFSKTAPFTLHRRRGDGSRGARYHIDHVQGDKRVVIGYDGAVAWWENPWSGLAWPHRITGLDFQVLMQDVDFVDALFDHEDMGYEVELVGRVDFEGREVIRIDLTRPGGAQESWYLDPETYLEVARDATGSELGGQAFPQRTVYDDFRDVGGVKIPFYVETDWYARHRVMEVAEVELNADVDDALFAMPTPPGMGELLRLVGAWDVKIESRPQPGLPWQERRGTAEIRSLLDGALVEERLLTAGGGETLSTVSYDSMRERYRWTRIDNQTLYQDVEEGTMNDGRLAVSNVDTGTPLEIMGLKFHQRSTLSATTGDGFLVEQELSANGGQNWFLAAKLTYTRRGD